MYSVKLDVNGFFTGGCARIGEVIDGGFEVDTLPPTDDQTKAKAYKWVGTSWEFDGEKYKELLMEIFNGMTPKPKLEERNRADIDYLLMITGEL